MDTTQPEAKKKHAGGRPSIYSHALALRICERIASGTSVARIAEHEGMPSWRVIYEWIEKRPDFAQMYLRAKEECADHLAEQILEIADEAVPSLESGGMDSAAVQRQRLRVDARKFIAAKLKPKKYGERTAVEHSGSLTLGQILAESRQDEEQSIDHPQP